MPPTVPKVVVIGAGPAGSSAATFLARGGIEVTLLERARFPRDKICGDGCTPRTVMMLGRLGLAELRHAEGAPVERLWATSPGGVVLDSEIPRHIFGGQACAIPRAVLDERLVQNAVRAGAKLREGVRVESVEVGPGEATVTCRGGERLRADAVLGCDGSPSVVRRALGAPSFPPEHSAFAVRAYYENVSLSRPRSFGIFWERELLPAYGWVFPLPGGRANVGVGLRADMLERSPAKLPELLERFCALPRVTQELHGARRVGKVSGHHLPFGSFARHLVFDRALLLGDAAGFINPLTGEGIEFALESGQFAAEAVTAAAERGDLSAKGLADYARRCRERFHVTFALNRRMMGFFSRPRLVDRVFRAANRSRRVRDDLADVLLGEAPRLGWRLLAALAFGL